MIIIDIPTTVSENTKTADEKNIIRFHYTSKRE